MILRTLTLLIGAVFFFSCSSPQEKKLAPESPKEEEAKDEWTYLFDGTSTEGWRGYNASELPANWIIEEGALKSLGTGGDVGGDIVYGNDIYENFELTLEWKISEGGNSGIFYHVVEDEKYKAPYETAPEYQVLDNIGFPEPLEDWQTVGADYAMYPANYGENTVKAANEWNTSRILFTAEKTEYWLNGEKMLEFVPYSEDWQERRNSGKWDDYPDYSISKSGLIGLQDHGSFIWYKNIRIRKL